MSAEPSPRENLNKLFGDFVSHEEALIAADARRNLRNMRESLRLLVLVLIVSGAMGAAAWAFLASLDAVTGFRERHAAVFLLLPVVSIATAWLYRRFGKEAARGNNLVIESALTERSVPARMAAMTFTCSVATHLAGGSAGREGTAVQIGGTIADNVARLVRLGARDHQDLMLAGISAAFGAVFGAPLAGTFFGMEMCYVGKINYSSGIYCLIASFTADTVCRALGCTHASYVIGAVPELEAPTVALAVIFAIVFGLTARLFSLAIRTVRRVLAHRITNYLVAALAGSLALLAVYFIFGIQRYAGLSTWLVEEGFAGDTTLADPFIKIALTALTLGTGFQGGEVTPLFGIGASLGGVLGSLVGIPCAFAAALGMLGVFGSALNVPITTIMLGVDLFGGAAMPYFVIVAFVSYLVAGHRGVYPAQRIVTPKRRSLASDANSTVADAIARHNQQDTNTKEANAKQQLAR